MRRTSVPRAVPGRARAARVTARRWLGPALRPVLGRLRRILGHAGLASDAGMNTAEYAVGTLAAVAFAGLLLKVVTSDAIRGALTRLIVGALG